MTAQQEPEYQITGDLITRVERALKLAGKVELATEFGAIRNCFYPHNPEPEHCHHECVCPKYRLHCAYGYPCTHNEEPMGTVVTDACEHDSRSRGHIQHNPLLPWIIGCTKQCDGCDAVTCAEACQEWVTQHDAAIAAKAREEVLDELYNGVDCTTDPTDANSIKCAGCSLAMTHVGHPEDNPLDTGEVFDGCLIESLRGHEGGA